MIRHEFYTTDQDTQRDLPQLAITFDSETGVLRVRSALGALVVRPEVSNSINVQVDQ